MRRQVELGGRQHDVRAVGGPQRQRGDHGLGELARTVRRTARRRGSLEGIYLETGRDANTTY